MAQRLDSATLMPVDDPQLVASQVAINPNVAISAISASAAGPIAYRASAGTRQLVWMDRSGREIARVGDSDAGQPGGFTLSRDGTQIVMLPPDAKKTGRAEHVTFVLNWFTELRRLLAARN